VASTFDEARGLAVWAKATGSAHHHCPNLNRELAPVGAHVLIDSHKPPGYDINDWWQNEGGVINFQNEVIKLHLLPREVLTCCCPLSRPTRFVTVNLKHVLGDIQTDGGNLHVDSSLM
jgi:hypothetical protein